MTCKILLGYGLENESNTAIGSDGHSSVYPTEWLVAHQHNNYQRHSRFKDEIYSQKSFPVR